MNLKRLAALALAILLCLGCVVTAFADMDSPSFSELEAYVNNENGITFYTSQRNPETDRYEPMPTATIPNGTKLTLRGTYYDYDDDGREETGADALYSTTYLGENGYVRGGDVSFNAVAVTPKESWKFSKPDELVVINPDGVPMYSGPDTLFERLSTVIPYGADIVCEYGNTGEYSDASWTSGWSYTTYNGTSGWVETPQYGNAYNFAYRESGESLVVEPVQLYASIKDAYESGWGEEDEQPKPIVEVPAGAFVTYDIVYRGAKRDFGYVTYQGKTGWMLVQDGFNGPGTEQVIRKSEGYLMVTAPKGVPVYGSIGDVDSKTGETIPAYEILRYDYAGMVDFTEYDDNWEPIGEEDCWTWYRVRRDGKQVWVRGNEWDHDKDDLSVFWHVSKEKVLSKNGMILYAQPRTQAEQLALIPTGATIRTEFDWSERFVDYGSEENVTWYYGVYDNHFGWVRVQGDKEEFLENLDQNLNYDELDREILLPANVKAALEAEETAAQTTTAQAGEETTAPAADAAAAADSKAVKASPRMIIIGCVAAAGILALVAVVTVALIQKRKKDETPTE
ncbi:MAG: hypothetical protein IK080_10810 [Clostridia bacterium]|nr:hypothetical protein [Clostridia bacterium]